MESKKILIIGGSGLVGRVLINRIKDFAEVYATYNTTTINLEGAKFYQLDVIDKNGVNELIQEIRPDVVIDAAYKRNTIYCEDNPDEAYKANVDGVRNVVNACKIINSKMVFFSSDQVFGGTKRMYLEEDKLCPLNVYGKQKVIAEKIVKDNLDDWLIIRASHIYAWSPRSDNFISWVINELNSGGEVKIGYDQFVTPIHVENFVDMLIKLLEIGRTGIYHVGDGECLSKYEFVKMIKETFNFDESMIIPVSSEELNQTAVRPKNNCLDLRKIKNEFDFGKYGIKNGLDIMKKERIVREDPSRPDDFSSS